MRDYAKEFLKLEANNEVKFGKLFQSKVTLHYTQAAEILSKETGKKISYIDIPEEDARKGLKQIGFEDWLIDAVIEGFNYFITGGYGSQRTTVVEQVTGRRPILFAQFAKDYADSFK